MSRPFHFKQFTINQTANSQKVGTDSMLLGAWVNGSFNRILDIGTGTGILALMMAQKNPAAFITAIEPDLDSFDEAYSNFQESPFRSQLLAIHTRLQDFGSIDKFDLIIANPPYFENAFLSKDADRNRTRHTADLPVFELYECASDLLRENGQFAVIIPFEEEENHFYRAAMEDLYPQRILRTLREDGDYKRTLIQFGATPTPTPLTKELLVKDASNRYSDTYIELTKDFYGKDLSK